MVERWKEYGTSGLMPGCWVVAASDYDDLSDKLAEAKRHLADVCEELYAQTDFAYGIKVKALAFLAHDKDLGAERERDIGSWK